MSQPDDAAAKRNKLVEARLAVEHTVSNGGAGSGSQSCAEDDEDIPF